MTRRPAKRLAIPPAQRGRVEGGRRAPATLGAVADRR